MSGMKEGRGRLFLLMGLLIVLLAAYFALPELTTLWTKTSPALSVVTENPSVAPSSTASVTPVLAVEETPTVGAAETTNAVASTSEDNGFVVLCYHRFVAHPERFKTALSEYRFPQAEFRWQMQYLKDHGITPISMEQLKDYWFNGKPLPAKPVLLTFDDGFRSIYDVMFPVLQQFKYPGVLFLYTDFIRDQGDSLTFEDIKAMQKYGLALESHTKSHLNLGYVEEKKTPEDFAALLTQELSEPVSYIQAKFGYTATTLAYPYGVYNDLIVNETQKQNYQLAFTVNPGPNDRHVPALKLKRDLILNPISHESFAALFEPKVLHLEKMNPDDGQVIRTHKPLISMVVADDIDYKTIKMFIGTASVAYRYNPTTRVLSHQVSKELKSGGHFLAVEAKDLSGQKRSYTWYFRIKHLGLGPAGNKTEDRMKGVDDK